MNHMPSYPMPYSHPMHEQVLMTVQHCEAVCEHMTTLLKGHPNVHMRTRQLLLLRDCADICTLTAKYIARYSSFAKHAAHLCAMICQECGTECSRFPDPESQHCAQVCFNVQWNAGLLQRCNQRKGQEKSCPLKFVILRYYFIYLYCFRRGSRASRSPSPNRLKPRTTNMIAIPGNIITCGAFWR